MNIQTESEREMYPSSDAVQVDDIASDILEAVHAGTWNWRNVDLGTVTPAPVRDKLYFENLARCEERVRHVLTSRFKSTFQYKDPEHSAMTATAAAMIRNHGVESMLKTFKESCPERTQEIIGRELLNPEDLLEIQPPTPDQLSQSADYLSLCTPSHVISPSELDTGLYVGSATGVYGLEGRWMTYDTLKTKASDGVRTSQMKGTHLGLALRVDYTMHLRAWLFFSSQRSSKQHCRLWEGFGMDLFNTCHLEDKTNNVYRTPEVLLEAAKAVPPDLAQQHSWKGLNDAHALKQGVGPANEFCYMQARGCSTEEASAAAEPGLFDTVANKGIYLCRPCSMQFYEFRTVWNCNPDGRRCSRPQHIHKVLSRANREDRFEAWQSDIVQKWAKQSYVNTFRFNLFDEQNWKCPCGRVFKRPDAEIDVPETFRATLLQHAPEPTLACDACYTDWSLHRPENATVLQLEQWKTARAAFRASVDAKPLHENCICSTDEKPILANQTVVKYKYDGLQKTCRTCYPMAPRVIDMYNLDMDDVQDNARGLRLFIGLRGSLSVQLERYPDAPNCHCACNGVRVPALLEWAAKDRFPLEEPKYICNTCRKAWTQVPSKYKTEKRARSMFD
jgi:hypothetical protein